jgi:hypothetical protein
MTCRELISINIIHIGNIRTIITFYFNIMAHPKWDLVLGL